MSSVPTVVMHAAGLLFAVVSVLSCRCHRAQCAQQALQPPPRKTSTAPSTEGRAAGGAIYEAMPAAAPARSWNIAMLGGIPSRPCPPPPGLRSSDRLPQSSDNDVSTAASESDSVAVEFSCLNSRGPGTPGGLAMSTLAMSTAPTSAWSSSTGVEHASTASPRAVGGVATAGITERAKPRPCAQQSSAGRITALPHCGMGRSGSGSAGVSEKVVKGEPGAKGEPEHEQDQAGGDGGDEAVSYTHLTLPTTPYV